MRRFPDREAFMPRFLQPITFLSSHPFIWYAQCNRWLSNPDNHGGSAIFKTG